MNLIGKILVVLNFVASLVFMSFAVMVYATHRNWRDEVLRPEAVAGKPKGLKHQLADRDKELQLLQQEKQRLIAEIERTKRTREHRLAQLESRYNALKKQRDDLQQQHATLLSSQAQAIQQMNAVQKRMDTLETEIAQLRQRNDELRQQRDQNLRLAIDADEQLAQIRNEYDRLRKRNSDLLAQVNELTLALQDADIQLDRKVPRVEGIILAINPSSGSVLINVGSDDGLEKGHTLEVYRLGRNGEESKYLGQISIVRTDRDRAYARIVPGITRGRIRRGDRVATRLQ